MENSALQRTKHENIKTSLSLLQRRKRILGGNGEIGSRRGGRGGQGGGGGEETEKVIQL